MSTSRRLVPIPEARHVLGGIGRSTVYQLVERRELSKVKVGRRAFITSESLDAYLDRLAARPDDDENGVDASGGVLGEREGRSITKTGLSEANSTNP